MTRFAIIDCIVTITESIVLFNIVTTLKDYPEFRSDFCWWHAFMALSTHGKNTRSYRWPSLLLQTAFADLVKPPRFTAEPVGPLRCINRTAWGAKLLPTVHLGRTYDLGPLWLVLSPIECTAWLPVYY